MKLSHIAALCVAVALGTVFAGSPAGAAEFPTKPIKMIVPWGAGGGMDNMTRILEPKATEVLGQPFTFEYKPGASGTIGTMECIKARPDGYTLSVNNYPLQVTNIAIGVAQYKPDDLQPVCMVAQDCTVIVVRKDAPWNTLQDLIDDAKKRPGQISLCAPDRFGPSHGTALLLERETGTKFNIVCMATGGSKGVAALLGGQVDAITGTLSTVMAMGEDCKALAVCNDKRIPQFKDTPTTVELGIPNVYGFVGRIYWAPKKTPEKVINKIADAFKAATDVQENRDRLLAAGMETIYLNHADTLKKMD
ncbi:MAG: tripartite tricarboxylate transporter substrate binding protein, partial [Mailhella sp.]|nr:tripartite tricarboxylate transporter substrate binding protein [Mailhella sp.]